MKRCPFCRSKKIENAAGNHHCRNCGAFFDDDPDEGGPSHNDPVKAAMAKERGEKRQPRRPLKGGL